MTSWVSLHNHSQYSILDSTASVKALAKKAKELQMPALALTDQGNLYGAVEFYKACMGEGVHPIIGCELYVAPFSRHDKKRIPGYSAGYPIVLLAKDREGYKSLCKLSSLAHLEGFYWTPRIDKECLKEYSKGLICISGPLNSRIAQLAIQDSEEELSKEINWYVELFGEDFYLEILRHEMSPETISAHGMDKESWLVQKYSDYARSQEKANKVLIAYAKKHNIPLVATNDTRYISPEDWHAHEILMNIQSGEPCEIWEKDSYGNNKAKIPNPKRDVHPHHEYYFKSPEQIKKLFTDIPEAVENTIKIAEKCKLEIDFKSKFYPVFVPPYLEGTPYTTEEREKAAEKFLRDLCQEGIKKRYNSERLQKVQEQYPDQDPLNVVHARLKYELDIITSKGMGDYLLIVYDFINWAKSQNIPVGPGRGSGAGSIILYLIGITDIEPLRFNLFFERFINPERLSYPDIDVDICMERRSEVIEYTLRKYGKDKVCQIITFGTMKAKMAIKDVGRVLNVPLSKVNAITKLVPEDLNITLDKALEVDPDLYRMYETDAEVKRLFDLARALEGSIRNTGIHAAGLIICGDSITNHIPVCSPKDSEIPVSQYSMKPVESVGMLKIDFLGLKTLTSIQKTVDAIQRNTGRDIDWVNLPLDDQRTFNLLNQGKTLGIFQLESGGMQDLAKQLHIDLFEEIIAVGALYRPGPMEMIPTFINRKHGREPIEFDHPYMKDILAETYGIMVYQEQVMQIAQKLANYSLGEGDVLRRAMGKKDKEEMARQREKFKIGALQNAIEEQKSMEIFDKVEKFASYGFNKSHAAAYGYISYATAYFKANYPYEWMAGLMTCDRDDISKVSKVIRDCQVMNIAILPPDVNESLGEFTATSNGIRFALTAIKGVGLGVVEAIIEERQKKGPFVSLQDFCQRVDTSKVGKKVIEHLIEAGAFDFTKKSRAMLLHQLEEIYQVAAKQQKEAAQGVMHLFSFMDETTESNEETVVEKEIPEFPRQHILKREKELLGFYLTGHPMDEYKGILKQLSCVPLSKISELPNDSVCRVAFIIDSLQVRISKTQRKFAILTISDGLERLELPIWPELYESKIDLMSENQLLYAVIHVDTSEGGLRLNCKWLENLTLVNEAVIQECDTAYDKAKHQVQQSAEMKEKLQHKKNSQASSSPPKKEKEAPEEKMKKLILSLDAERMKLSEVLRLKKLFRDYPGDQAIDLIFESNEKAVATVKIEPMWGVKVGSEVKEGLQKISSVKKWSEVDG